MIKNGIIQDTNIFGIPFRVDLIPVTNKTSRPQIAMTPKMITQHNTGNSKKGANADMHTEYVDTATGYVSWHFTVDDKQIIQELPINEVAWHAGDGRGPGNMTTIAIESCENDGINWAKCRENSIKLITYLIQNVPSLIPDPVRPHKTWSGKYCPHLILDEGWDKYILDIAKFRQSLVKEMSYEEANKIVCQHIGLDEKYWSGKENIDKYFKDRVIKTAKFLNVKGAK